MIVSNSYVQPTQNINRTSATSAYSQNTKPDEVETFKLEQMQEKYADVYTPIPETYSKADEDLQTSKIYEAFPKYLTLEEMWNKSMSFYEGEPIQLGVPLTSAQTRQQEIASVKRDAWINEEFGGEDTLVAMNKGAQDIRDSLPINYWAKDESVQNAKELSRAYNAALYQSLESGATIENARSDAITVMNTFMSTKREGSNSVQDNEYKVDFDAPNNAVMDLRKYGIEGNWEQYTIYDNKEAMVSEIENKINQFNFMLNNEGIVKEAYNKLDGNYHDIANNAGYKDLIKDKYMPKMELALDVLKNYKIYDSIDTRA